MSLNGTGIVHLEVNDFKGKVLCFQDKPVEGKWLCMIQGSFCGYCTQAKPEFIKASRMAKGKAVFCTVQIDGSEGEQKLSKKLKTITGYDLGGVPAYILFEDGKSKALHKGNRDSVTLIEFIEKN